MSALGGPVLALALLLVAAGAAKVLRPGDTSRALGSVGWPVGPGAVRVAAAAEAALGAAYVVFGGAVAAALVSASYAAFACFVGYALARGGVVASCGCFGEPDTPPTVSHLAACAGGAAIAAVGAWSGGPSAWGLLRQHPAQDPALVLLVAAAAYSGYLLMAAAPRLAARRAGR